MTSGCRLPAFLDDESDDRCGGGSASSTAVPNGTFDTTRRGSVSPAAAALTRCRSAPPLVTQASSRHLAQLLEARVSRTDASDWLVNSSEKLVSQTEKCLQAHH